MKAWMRVSSIMDSGAAESVAPPTTCPHLPVTESLGSRAGQEHRTAGGERLNKGQRHIHPWTDEGCPVGMTYQVADVTIQLNSVSKMCDAGDAVTFGVEGITELSRICGLAVRRTSDLSLECMLNTWVKKGTPGGTDFARQAV